MPNSCIVLADKLSIPTSHPNALKSRHAAMNEQRPTGSACQEHVGVPSIGIASLSDPPARRIGAFTETDDPGQRKRKPKLWLKSFAASKAVQGLTRCHPAVRNAPPQSVPAG